MTVTRSDYGVLAPYRECYACKKVADAPGCSQDDRGNSIFIEMMTSDLIVLASPIFCWGVSAQMKALLDRAFCLLKEEERLLLAGKRMALAATTPARSRTTPICWCRPTGRSSSISNAKTSARCWSPTARRP